MRFEEIKSKEDLIDFFKKKGFQFQDYDSLIKIDNSNFMKFEILEVLDNEVCSRKHREFRKTYKSEIQYVLLADKEFTKFVFLRDYGTPIKFSYDKTKNYARETEGALFKKLNNLNFSEEDFNEPINNLFDIKEIVNKFYSEYRSIKNKLAKAIKNLNGNEQDYAQVILDRFIFIYFLETKGILSPFYLSNLYYNKKKKQDFYEDYLKILFFECLNKEQDSNQKDRIINEINFGKIPYLNGGLFSEKKMEINSPNIKVDDKVWDDIFKLLNKYEWVVEEEQGDSTTLTPSILGHIFEKSMTEDVQKGTGSYYTPEEITNYISKNTIYPFLQNRLNEKFNGNIKNLYSDLLENDNPSKEDIEKVNYLYEQVKKLTILDNACGSGAFLIAAQQILFPIYNKCIFLLKGQPFFKEEMKKIIKHHSWHYYIKRTIITNNLYGVDIQEGAVDIAKLRLWLSMVSEMNLDLAQIEPLPNIDYNILCGNSLIGFTRAIKTGGLQEHLELDVKESVNSLKFAFPSVAKELDKLAKSPSVENLIKIKEMLVDLFRKEQNSIASKILRGVLINIDEKLQEKLDLLYLSHVNSKLKKPIIDLNISSSQKVKELSKEINIFHWNLGFSDILGNGHLGFDVIVGNPPYGNILSKFEKEFLTKEFVSLKSDKDGKGSTNASSVFIEQSLKIVKKEGFLSYIVPNSIPRIQQFEKIRKLIDNNHSLIEIYDEGSPFVGVKLEMVTIIIKNSEHKNINTIGKSKKTKSLHFIPTKTISELGYIPIYYDQLFEEVREKAVYGEFHALQGKPRRADYVENGYRCISARIVDPFFLKLNLDQDRIVSKNFNYINNELNEDLLITPYFFGTDISSLNKDVFEVTIKPKGYICDGTAILLFTKNKYLNYLTIALNSKIVNHIMKKYILNYSIRDITIREYEINKLPLHLRDVALYNRLVKIMETIAEQRYEHKKEEDIKKEYAKLMKLINYLMYEIFVFHSHEIEDLLQDIKTKEELLHLIDGNKKLQTLYKKIEADKYYSEVFTKVIK